MRDENEENEEELDEAALRASARPKSGNIPTGACERLCTTKICGKPLLKSLD